MADDRLEGAVDLGGDRQHDVGHHLDRAVLAEQHVQLLRDVRDGENLRDRPQRLDMRRLNEPGRRDTTFRVPTPRPFETSGMISADLNPAVNSTFASSRSTSAAAMSVISIGSSGPDHPSDRGALDLEHDVRTRPVAALVLVDAGGEGLELLPGLGQQREADPVARHQAARSRSASAWNVNATSTDRATICSIAFCVCSCSTSSSVARCACSRSVSRSDRRRCGGPRTPRARPWQPSRSSPGSPARAAGRRHWSPATSFPG